jgi:hypothetical protein
VEQPGRWRTRISLDELRTRRGTYPPDQWTRQDAEANEAKRLGADKQVKLCSLMLVEVSPPATNHTLIESYRRLPFLSAADVRRVSRELAKLWPTESARSSRVC